MDHLSNAISAGLVFLIGLLPAGAWGYCRSYAATACHCEDAPNSRTCAPGNNTPLCATTPECDEPAHWPLGNRCVVYHINDATLPAAEREAYVAAIQQSFGTWTDAECAAIEFVAGGFTNDTYTGYLQERTNGNVVLFKSKNWGHPQTIIGVTSVTLNESTGEIVDADIEFNDQYFNFTTTTDVALAKIDVANSVTHEVGHFLGLDHTSVMDATMFASAPEGEFRKRDLHDDDLAGLCATYPMATIGTCDVDSKIGDYNPLDPPKPIPGTGGSGSNCSIKPGSKVAPVTKVWLVLAGCGLGLYRGRRPRPRLTSPGNRNDA